MPYAGEEFVYENGFNDLNWPAQNMESYISGAAPISPEDLKTQTFFQENHLNYQGRVQQNFLKNASNFEQISCQAEHVTPLEDQEAWQLADQSAWVEFHREDLDYLQDRLTYIANQCGLEPDFVETKYKEAVEARYSGDDINFFLESIENEQDIWIELHREELSELEAHLRNLANDYGLEEDYIESTYAKAVEMKYNGTEITELLEIIGQDVLIRQQEQDYWIEENANELERLQEGLQELSKKYDLKENYVEVKYAEAIRARVTEQALSNFLVREEMLLNKAQQIIKATREPL